MTPVDTHGQLTRYLGDPALRRAVKTVKNRVLEIQKGSPVSPWPTEPHSKRHMLLSTAQPFLNDMELRDLDQFMTMRLMNRSATPGACNIAHHTREISL